MRTLRTAAGRLVANGVEAGSPGGGGGRGRWERVSRPTFTTTPLHGPRGAPAKRRGWRAPGSVASSSWASAAGLGGDGGVGVPPWDLDGALGSGGGGTGLPPDTIYALSTPPGRAALAIVRISGPGADEVLARLAPGLGVESAPPRTLRRALLRHPATNEPLDDALFVRFPGARSATGEPVVELHLHGGRAVVRGVLDALEGVREVAVAWGDPAEAARAPGGSGSEAVGTGEAREGPEGSGRFGDPRAAPPSFSAPVAPPLPSRVRPAEAGEFTRRAFSSGKLDVSEVEGLSDLLAAETGAQRRAALAAAHGAVAERVRAWRRRLIEARARVEAVLDFGDDEEIADEVAEEALGAAAELATELEAELASARRGEISREGVRVALAGPPNAGKSSLLNLLAGREAAIVSNVPGTTRDVLEVALEVAGYRALVSDSAGIRDTDDPLEREGVRRARELVRRAHVVLDLRDAAELSWGTWPGDATEGDGRERRAANPPLGEAWSDAAGGPDDLPPFRQRVLRVINKSDLLAGSAELGDDPAAPATLISCSTGEGIEELLRELERAVREVAGEGREGEAAGGLPAGATRHADVDANAVPGAGPSVHSQAVGLEPGDVAARSRRRAAVRDAAAALRRAHEFRASPELAAEALREAGERLAAVAGDVDSEDVLDSLFSEFCIGK